MKSDGPLTPDEVEHFLEHGFVVVRGAFSRKVAEEATEEAFERVGYDRHDPATWEETRIHLPSTRFMEVPEFAPRVWDATCQLLGGEERVKQPYKFSNGYILNLGIGADEPQREPGPECPGWHKDGDFFRHFLDSPEQGLLTIVAWTDVVPLGGPTYIATDSVPVVARCLAEHPEGLDPRDFGKFRLIEHCARFAEATAEAGDVYLMHPYMLHAASQNRPRVERIITNPPVTLKEPMEFNRDDPADFSPVERAVLRGLGVERLDFQPTRERIRIVPERVKRQQAMLEAEKARGAG